MAQSKENIPRHVAVIMDGNGRWAEKRKLPRVMGHNAGMRSMREIVRRSSDMGIEYLTVYAFSTENWKRSEEEVGGIFRLLVKFVDSDLEELYRNNVRVNVLGVWRKLPAAAVDRLERTIERTKENDGMCFNICLNYGSRAEITDAVRELAQKVKSGEIEPEDIDEQAISGALLTGKFDIPDPDLLIRTSGEIRISNYLLWQIAYSEMIFTDILWPDLDPDTYEELVLSYKDRDRRFGGRNK